MVSVTFVEHVGPNSVLVDFDDGIGRCRFDLKFIYDNGSDVLRRNVNICRVDGFALSDR